VSEARRQTRIVHEAFLTVAAANGGQVSVGDIATCMRDLNRPMGAWEIRGELSQLRKLGLIDVDENAASWFAVDGQDFDTAAAAT